MKKNRLRNRGLWLASLWVCVASPALSIRSATVLVDFLVVGPTVNGHTVQNLAEEIGPALRHVVETLLHEHDAGVRLVIEEPINRTGEIANRFDASRHDRIVRHHFGENLRRFVEGERR